MTAPKYRSPVKDPITWPGKFQKKFPGNPYPWEFRCPAPFCFYVIVAPDEETLDERIEGHKCPWFGGGTTTFSWGVMSDDYIGPIWLMLDQKVDIIKDLSVPEPARVAARHQARGLAEALAVLMVPFFRDSTSIALEASRRHECRQKGEPVETPGLGRMKWKRPDETHDPSRPSWLTKKYEEEFDAEQAAIKAQKRKAEEEKAKFSHSLDEATVTLIKNSKAFPPEILSAAYGVSADVIKHIWNQ